VALSGSAPRRYAEAMHDLAQQENAAAGFRASLEDLAAGFGPATVRALRDPSVPMRQRIAALEAATAGHPRAIGSLLRLLAERDRIALLPAIAREFGAIVDRRAGIAPARITTAVPLEDDARRTFVERLERASGRKLKATFTVDPSLIGGAKVQVGDHLVDSTVRAKLDALRARLAS
jgi:F-type H+-transporting ATPase subunit delta